MKIYLLIFYIHTEASNGYALVVARNPNQAAEILSLLGRHSKAEYKVTSIKEMGCASPCVGNHILTEGITSNGLSAYEIAVLYGFTGTIQEWLASLKGEKGDINTKITLSEDGYWVVDGVKSTVKAQGEQGIPGISGTSGLSAYEIAVQHGFTGTETQWVNDVMGASIAAIRALLTEITKLKNSFIYGITSYQGLDTAQGAILEGYSLEGIEDKEPLWAIDESELTEILELKENFTSSHYVNIKPKNSTTLDISIPGVVGIVEATWEDLQEILSVLEDSKLITVIGSEGNDIVLNLKDKNNPTSEGLNINLSTLTPGISVSNYHYMIIISRQYNKKGKRFIYITVENATTGLELIAGYYKEGTLVINPAYIDTDYYIEKINFANIKLTDLRFYTKYQDFTTESIPRAPKDINEIKYAAAHITIREVENDTTLDSIKHNLLKPELIWVADTLKLKINTSKGIFTIGSSTTPEKPNDNYDMEAIKDALSEMGIIQNDSSLQINNIERLSFINKNKEVYDISIDSEGKIVTTKENSIKLETYVNKAKTINFPSTSTTTENFNTPSLKGFAAKILYTIKALNCPLDAGVSGTELDHIQKWQNTYKTPVTGDWKLYADRIKIGQVYIKGTSNTPKCSHAFVELENTSDEDFPLDGCELYFYNIDNSISISLTGTILAGGTYLIRGKQYISYENSYIKVKTYDLEWLQLDTTSTLVGDVGFMLVYKDADLALNNNYPQSMISTLSSITDPKNKWNLTADNIKTSGDYPYIYDYHYIDSMFITSLETGSKFAPLKGQYSNSSNCICKNNFELDPAKQAFQGLTLKDSSRIRGTKATDCLLIPLDKNQMVFDKSFIIRNIDVYTPKASYEHKSVITDKTLIDTEKPNMVTCSFGINIHTTRCFNWISTNESDEFVFIKNGNSWERFESYGGNNRDITISGGFTKKVLSGDAESIIYNRMRGIFPGTNIKYVGHKCILNHTVVDTPTTFTYIVGRAGEDGNPDLKYCSEEYTFTLYPTSYTPRIYQITDLLGFHWIEYQVWAAAALEVEKRIQLDYAENNIIPILVNTGDMTLNGTRINEWLDYYKGGLCLFKHLEQMNVVGNNDLCNADESILGTGDDNGKINPYYFHLFYCYEQPNPREFIFNGKYVPSTYYFGNDNYKFLMVNSEITYNACNLMYLHESETLTNIYTGYTMGTISNASFNLTFNSNITPIYNTLYTWLNTYRTATWTVACHEMPFTVITHNNLKEVAGETSRSIDHYKASLVGSHLNLLYQHDTKGSYWFSRLLEYFGIKLCIGGHKHTYVCTFPLRENFKWTTNDTTHYSIEELYEMPSSLENDNISWKDKNNTNYNSTKIPASFISTASNTVQVIDGIMTPLIAGAGDKNLNYVTYFMCQATGYKVKSNKELPSSSLAFAKVVAGTSGSAAQESQLYPMYAIISYNNSDIKTQLLRIGNIFTIDKIKHSEYFSLLLINKNPIEIECLSALNTNITIVEDNTVTSTRWELEGNTPKYIYSSTDNYIPSN